MFRVRKLERPAARRDHDGHRRDAATARDRADHTGRLDEHGTVRARRPSRATRSDRGSSVAKPLVIVESPAKAQDHRGLPRSRRLRRDGERRPHPRPPARREARSRRASPTRRCAALGIDVDDHFDAVYVVPDDEEEGRRRAEGGARRTPSELILATDEDREGEAIALARARGARSRRCRSSGWCSTRSRAHAIARGARATGATST